MARTAKMALVTGGAGFIGSNLVQELVRKRWKVRVLDDFSTGKTANLERLAGRLDVVRGDIRTAAAPSCLRRASGTPKLAPGGGGSLCRCENTSPIGG